MTATVQRGVRPVGGRPAEAGAAGRAAQVANGPDVGEILDRRDSRRPVVVVVPVHNGGGAVATCLASVLRWTPNARIVVIDDCSTDSEVVAHLDHLAATSRIELTRFTENRGYTRTANYALHLDDASDVVLLNSDTEVGPLWLERLGWVAASRPGVATVSAVSDNAGAMAVPVPGVANDWPGHLPWSEVARAAARADLPFAVETPTGHGFCMFVSRDAVRRVGGFDERLFPRGYGEENDFCQRAIEAGMVNLVAPHVFVRHEKSQSFGSAREGLIRQGRDLVDERHPGYTAAVSAWMSGEAMRAVRAGYAELRERVAEVDEVRPVRLNVLHRSTGGTPATNLDLMTALSSRQDGYLVEASADGTLTLHEVTGSGLRTLESWQAGSPFTVTDTFRRDYADVVARWVIELGVETVHARHLINQPFTAVAEVCRRTGVRFVLSTHDFYMVCPSVHLLDENLRFCGGRCTPGIATCRMPTPFVAAAPDLKHRWIHEWRRRAAEVFAAADAVVATTLDARSTLSANFPEVLDRIRVIEHGRDVESWAQHRRTARQPGPPRILAVANWDPHKGTEYLRAMARALGDRVEFHVFGQRSDDLADVGVVHGRYQREDFPALVAEVDPDLVALVSVWPETYSHTLSEAWALGVPVLATDIGAVAERIRLRGGGVLVPVDDPESGAGTALAVLGSRERMAELRDSVPTDGVRPLGAMVEDYRALYETGSTARPVLGYVVRGRLGRHPGSAHVRVLRRLADPQVDAAVRARQVFPEEVVRTGRCEVDTLLVQRDAVAGDVEAFLDVVQREGVRLVVELDDDLVGEGSVGRLDPDPLLDAILRGNLTRLLERADAVVVSTDELARRIEGRTGGPLHVVANGLDPRLWLAEAPTGPPEDDEPRLVYMGTRTHAADLELLRGVLPRLRERLGRPVGLDVIGVTDSPEDWFRAVPIPRGLSNYPGFVPWLRRSRGRWSAAVAPLVDTGFNRAKSDLKLLEYAGLGLATVASDVGPYRGNDALARRVPNTTQAWVEALADVLGGDARDEGRRARDLVIAERMLPASDGAWLRALLGTR